jgi:hypothetical protein
MQFTMGVKFCAQQTIISRKKRKKEEGGGLCDMKTMPQAWGLRQR